MTPSLEREELDFIFSLYKSDKELELLPTLQKIDSLGEDVKLLIKKLERIETDLKEIKKEILEV